MDRSYVYAHVQSTREYTLTVPAEETREAVAAKYLPLFRPCNPGKDTRVVRVWVIIGEIEQ